MEWQAVRGCCILASTPLSITPCVFPFPSANKQDALRSCLLASASELFAALEAGGEGGAAAVPLLTVEVCLAADDEGNGGGAGADGTDRLRLRPAPCEFDACLAAALAGCRAAAALSAPRLLTDAALARGAIGASDADLAGRPAPMRELVAGGPEFDALAAAARRALQAALERAGRHAQQQLLPLLDFDAFDRRGRLACTFHCGKGLRLMSCRAQPIRPTSRAQSF